MFGQGDTIGDYEIVSPLNQGGMATLYLGRKIGAARTDPLVAIKVIHEGLSGDWQFVRMFIDEALISVRIRHPNVIRVDELGESESRYYLAMEYVHGGSVAQLLRALGKAGRRMRPEIAVWIASQVADGLHAAHEMTGDEGQLINVIHRDVSPQNVLLSVEGGVKLLDFGIAKAAGRAERTEAGVIKGKVRYMAPEQAMGATLDRRVDVYALGVVLWEMLTMRRFIEGKSEVEVIRKVRNPEAVPPSFRAQGITSEIDQAVMTALAVDRSARPPTAAAFADRLRHSIRESAIPPRHLAELLRVFLGEELASSTDKLPGDVSEALRALSTPGQSAPPPEPDEHRVTRELTMPQIESPSSRPAELGSGGREAPTRGAKRTATRPPLGVPQAPLPPPQAHVRHTIRALTPAEANPRALRGHSTYAEDEDDEQTMEASGPELQQFLARIRADSSESVPPPAEPSLSGSTHPGYGEAPIPHTRPRPDASRRPESRPRVTAPAVPPAPPHPMQAPAEPSPPFAVPPTDPHMPPPSIGATSVHPPPSQPKKRGWLLPIALTVVVAFVLGAGVALAILQLMK